MLELPLRFFAENIDEFSNNDPLRLPVKASEYATEVDHTFYVEYGICAFFGLLIYGLTAFYCLKYRRRKGNELPPHIRHNYPLEIFWTIVPTVICFWMFFVGAGGYLTVMGAAPKDARIVNVYGKQWFWEFTQATPAGATHKSDVLYLEVNKPVQLRMISRDVLHSLYMPSMREKMDVIPNRYTTMNVMPIREGTYDLYCTEYCGDQHSGMISKVKVLSTPDYLKEMENVQIKPAQLYAKCAACHDLENQPKAGPSWKGLWGKSRAILEGGVEKQITVDEAYIRESVRDPNVKMVKETPQGGMIAFPEDQLTEQELHALVLWIKEGSYDKDFVYDEKTKTLVKEGKE